MNLAQSFLAALENAGNSPLFLEEGKSISFAGLAARSRHLANVICTKQTAKSEFIAILLPNSIDFAAAFWGVILAGKTAIPCNFMLQPLEFIPLFEYTQPALLLTHSFFKPLVHAVNATGKVSLKALYLDELSWEGEETRPISPSSDALLKEPESPAMLLFTAGTSAKSKGVLLSHKNILANLEGCQRVLKIDQQDVFLGILPYFHSFGMTTSFLLPMLKGARIVLIRTIQSQSILDSIEKERVTALIMVPPLYGLLLKFPGTRAVDFSSIRMAVSGGGPLSPSMEEVFPKLTGKTIFNGYGLTEASPVVSVNSLEECRKGSIGKPLFNVAVSIHDDQETKLTAGQTGEIYIKGENVMMGYLDSEEETKKVVTPDKMLRTGDMGFLDEDGFLYITGRKKELIICSGENVHPLEIESVLNSHPKIEDSAVIGVQDPMRGEHAKAFVKLSEGQNAIPGEIRHFCLEKMATFKVPREFVFVDDFPRNSLGKILKRLLK